MQKFTKNLNFESRKFSPQMTTAKEPKKYETSSRKINKKEKIKYRRKSSKVGVGKIRENKIFVAPVEI